MDKQPLYTLNSSVNAINRLLSLPDIVFEDRSDDHVPTFSFTSISCQAPQSIEMYASPTHNDTYDNLPTVASMINNNRRVRRRIVFTSDIDDQ